MFMVWIVFMYGREEHGLKCEKNEIEDNKE